MGHSEPKPSTLAARNLNKAVRKRRAAAADRAIRAVFQDGHNFNVGQFGEVHISTVARKQTSMISIGVTHNIGGLGLNSASLLRKIQMDKVGNFALQTVIARAKRGIGSDDSPMPPLKGSNVSVFNARVNGKPTFKAVSGYAQWKSKHGLQPDRDLVGDGKQGGHMLDNPSVRKASETEVRIAFTSRSARVKALANEKRVPFFSFSDADQTAILAYVSKMWGAGVRELQQQIGLRRAA